MAVCSRPAQVKFCHCCSLKAALRWFWCEEMFDDPVAEVLKSFGGAAYADDIRPL
jgi:hypothetical protein